MARLNQRRVDIVYQEVDHFCDKNGNGIFFNCYEVLDDVIRKFHLEGIFNYDQELSPFEKIDFNKEGKNQIDFMENKFRSFITNLIRELFQTDVILDDSTDYNMEFLKKGGRSRILKVDFKKNS